MNKHTSIDGLAGIEEQLVLAVLNERAATLSKSRSEGIQDPEIPICLECGEITDAVWDNAGWDNPTQGPSKWTIAGYKCVHCGHQQSEEETFDPNNW